MESLVFGAVLRHLWAVLLVGGGEVLELLGYSQDAWYKLGKPRETVKWTRTTSVDWVCTSKEPLDISRGLCFTLNKYKSMYHCH